MNTVWKKLKKSNFADNITLIIAMVLLVALFGALNPNYVTGSNLSNILIACSLTGFVAIGETNLIIAGQNDLSAGSVAACAGVLAALLSRMGVPVWLALLIAVGTGCLVGAINAALVTFLKLQPFIATLASMQMADGAIMAFTGGQNYSNLPASFNFLGQGYIGFIPFPVVIMIIVLFITYIILAWTPVGRALYAIGGNQAAALASGIRVKRAKFFACAFGGVCTGLAGILLMARMSSGQPAAGEGMEMDAITAVIVGGTSMSGGVGNILNTIVGSLIIGIIKNFMNLQNINSSFQDIVLGILICVAVIIDVQVRKANTK